MFPNATQTCPLFGMTYSEERAKLYLMKDLKVITQTILLVLLCGCTMAQKSELNSAKEENYIIEFYSKYAKTWDSITIKTPELFERSMDSLTKKYCSLKLQKEAMDWILDGQDLLTNEWGINVEDLDSFIVKRDIINLNSFFVTYYTYLDIPGATPQKQVVKLHIILSSSENNYKIESVEGVD